MSFYDKSKLEKAQAKIRESATPAQNKLMREVDEAFAAECADMEARFEAENKLRAWARSLCGFSLDMTEIEEFRTFCQQQKPGMFTYRAKRGESAQLVKTIFGTVDKAANYINVLEKTVIDVTNNSQFTALSSSGLIKLAFKRLFKRSK